MSNSQEKKPEEEKEVLRFMATGRRKEATAQVQIIIGRGRPDFTVNGRKWDEYFTTPSHRLLVREPLEKSQLRDTLVVRAKVKGGGITGQAGAVRLGLARAIVTYRQDLKSLFKKEKFLTRDPRSKERKKYGRRGARRRFQWTKR